MTRRLLVAAVLSVLFIAAAVVLSWVRTGLPSPPGVTQSAPHGTPTIPAPETAPPAPTGRTTLPVEPESAEEQGAEGLLAAGEEVAAGEWEPLGHPAWPVVERPVYVGRASLEERRRVEADVVIAFRADHAMDEVPLRMLPAARALDGGALELVVRRDGAAAPHRIDRSGARLLVDLDPPLAPGDAVTLRVMASYDLLPHDHIAPDGGPPSYGLLAWTPLASVLGHWLPLLTVDGGGGPMARLGDVGGFPAAVWSLIVESDSQPVSGGDEVDCPDPRPDCTWVRGVALRDVALVIYEDEVVHASDEVAGTRLRTVAPPRLEEPNRYAHAHAARSLERFSDDLGPLAWRSVDVAAVPLAGRAAGMEFPGLVLIDLDMYATMVDGFGASVVVHEVAHQWFHALVGNASPTDAVVDEAVAQYLTYLHWSEEFGNDAGARLAEEFFLRRYDEALRSGMPDAPPARDADAFTDDQQYSVLIYARAPLALLEAEDRLGREEVVGFLRGMVERHGLAEVDAEGVLAEAGEHHDDLADAIRRWWFEQSPERGTG